MMDSLAVFSFHETHPIRVQIIDGEPWFCLKDICDTLTIENSRRVAAEVLDQSGVRKTYVRSGGQNRKVSFVNEPNLYRVIFRSNKPEARQFQDWVFNVVLPTIRKTGAYQYQPLAPKLAGEPLTAQDHDELKWLISDVAQSFHFSRSWVTGIWFALRRATGNPSPNPFLITELPVIVYELRRVLKAAEYAQLHMRKYEADVLKIVIRGGQDVTSVSSLDLKELNAVVDTALLPARFEVAMDKLLKLESRVP
jgi:prophage antirepressor-like protein